MRRGIAGHDSALTRRIGRQAGHSIDNRSTHHLCFFDIPSAGCPKRKPDAAAAECSGMLEIGRGRKPTRRQRRSGQPCLWANMEWALMDFPGTHDIAEYESRTNYMLSKYDMATLGTYDLAKSSALVMDVLRTTRACDRWRHIAREPVLRAAG
jgi:hypothetical protein